MCETARIFVYLFWHSEEVDLHILIPTGVGKGSAVNMRETILWYSLKCIFKNASYLWQLFRCSNIQERSIFPIELFTWQDLWYDIKWNYQYPEVSYVTCRVSLCLWLMVIIMLYDNSDKGEWTLNWLANENFLLVLWKLWIDDNVSDSCFCYLITMISDTWVLGQRLKVYLTGATSCYGGTQPMADQTVILSVVLFIKASTATCASGLRTPRSSSPAGTFWLRSISFSNSFQFMY